MLRLWCVLPGCAVLALSAAAAHGGAWTMEKGHGQVMVTATPSWASSVFTNTRGTAATPSYNKFELQALFEYGLSDRLTAIVMPGLQHVTIDAPTNATRTGLGYTEAGVRYRVVSGENWVLSGQGTFRLPGAFDTANPAAVGYTGIETDLRVLGGVTFAMFGAPAYLDVQLAQRFRSDGPPNEFRADFTLGYRPAPDWLLLAQSYNVFSEGAGGPLFPSYDYHKLQLGVAYDLTPHWSLLAAAFTTFSGRNALQEDGATLGVWYRF